MVRSFYFFLMEIHIIKHCINYGWKGNKCNCSFHIYSKSVFKQLFSMLTRIFPSLPVLSLHFSDPSFFIFLFTFFLPFLPFFLHLYKQNITIRVMLHYCKIFKHWTDEYEFFLLQINQISRKNIFNIIYMWNIHTYSSVCIRVY